MNKILISILAFSCISTFAVNIECTDGTYLITNLDPKMISDVGEDKYFNLKLQSGVKHELLPNLSLVVNTAPGRTSESTTINIVVAKTGPGSWEPVASSKGLNIAQLNINSSSLARQLFIPLLNGYYNLPQKKFFESRKKYRKKLEHYLHENNDEALLSNFGDAYGPLASFTCRIPND